MAHRKRRVEVDDGGDDEESVKKLKAAGIEVDGGLGEVLVDQNILKHLFLVGVLTGQFTALDIVRVARVSRRWNGILDDTTPGGLWYTIFMALADKHTLYVDPVTKAPLKPAVVAVTKPPLSVDIHSINWRHYVLVLISILNVDPRDAVRGYPDPRRHVHLVGPADDDRVQVVYYPEHERILTRALTSSWTPVTETDWMIRMVEMAADFMGRGYYIQLKRGHHQKQMAIRGQIDDDTCANCGSAATVGTCVCGDVHYCSQRCMTSHWTGGHGKVCGK